MNIFNVFGGNNGRNKMQQRNGDDQEDLLNGKLITFPKLKS